ncbi:MAG: class II fructose-bisphosphate aldolase [bacterium]
MKTLRQSVEDALARKVAIGHFNISNLEGFWAVVRAAETISEKAGRPVPVIIGVSEGERDFVGVPQVRALVDTVNKTRADLEKSTGVACKYGPVYLNADHTYSFDRVKEVIDAGFDAAIFDGTELSFDDNVATTKKCVDYAHAKMAEAKAAGVDRDILIEAELGFIGKSSEIHDAPAAGVSFGEDALTKVDEAKKFIELTGADMLAPAIGNMHGLLKNMHKPALNTTRVADIAAATSRPLVLHGGSGDFDADFVKVIDAGVAIVHINTELRVAYRDALKLSIQANPDEVAPYKFAKPALHAMQAVVEKKLAVFNKLVV